MGVGVPFAIGAQIAKPDNTIICIDGDGSFNMTLTELGTIAEYDIPVKIAIMNDSRQQMVYVWQKLFFNSQKISRDNSTSELPTNDQAAANLEKVQFFLRGLKSCQKSAHPSATHGILLNTPYVYQNDKKKTFLVI